MDKLLFEFYTSSPYVLLASLQAEHKGFILKLLSHYEQLRQKPCQEPPNLVFLEDSACHSCLFMFVPRNISENLG